MGCLNGYSLDNIRVSFCFMHSQCFNSTYRVPVLLNRHVTCLVTLAINTVIFSFNLEKYEYLMSKKL